MLFKGLHRVLVERGEEDDIGAMLGIEHADHLQAADARHLDIQKQHVRAQLVHRANRFDGIPAFADDLNIRLGLQQNTQVFTRQRLVVDN